MKRSLAYKEEIQGFDAVLQTVKAVERIAASSIARLRREREAVIAYQKEVESMLARFSLFYDRDERFEMQQRKLKSYPIDSHTADSHSNSSGTTSDSPHSNTFDSHSRAEQTHDSNAHDNETAHYPNAMNGNQSALIVITSDKGLTGGLWRKVVDEFLKNAKTKYNVIIPFGIKGEGYIREEKIEDKVALEHSRLANEKALAGIMADFNSGVFSRVDILYPQFISIIEQKPAIVPFLPFTEVRPQYSTGIGLPVIDGAKADIFNSLAKKYVESFFKKAVVESALSEVSARTMSMERASEKTEELIHNLTLRYRKEYRRSITQKQLESFIFFTHIK